MIAKIKATQQNIAHTLQEMFNVDIIARLLIVKNPNTLPLDANYSAM